MTDAYDRGEQHRQTILDLLREHGLLGITEIAEMTGASVPTVHKRVQVMLDLKELERIGRPRYKYAPVVGKTQPANVFRDQHKASIAAYNEARRKRLPDPEHRSATRVEGPVTTHVCSEHGFSPISTLDI